MTVITPSEESLPNEDHTKSSRIPELASHSVTAAYVDSNPLSDARPLSSIASGVRMETDVTGSEHSSQGNTSDLCESVASEDDLNNHQVESQLGVHQTEAETQERLIVHDCETRLTEQVPINSAGTHSMNEKTDEEREVSTEKTQAFLTKSCMNTDPQPAVDDLCDADTESTDDRVTDVESDDELAEKRRQLLTALSCDAPDVTALRHLACTAGGLLDDAIRRRAWPVLLQLKTDGASGAPEVSDEQISSHHYYNQVLMDVARTLKRFPPGIDDVRRLGLQGSLVTLIVRSLMNNPELHYYQGYHDVAITVLLVCGERLALPVLSHLAAHQLSVFMAATMEETQDLLTYMLPILESTDPPVCEFLVRSEAMATFALPWLITWFSHVLPHYSLITRLFDYVLATSWLAPVYVSAALVLARRDELLAGECDLAAVHSLLTHIPAHLPWEGLLARATHLLAEQPPEAIRPRVDALNRARRRGEREERERLQARRDARQKRRAEAAEATEAGRWLGVHRWRLVGVTACVAVLAVTVHYWRSHGV